MDGCVEMAPWQDAFPDLEVWTTRVACDPTRVETVSLVSLTQPGGRVPQTDDDPLSGADAWSEGVLLAGRRQARVAASWPCDGVGRAD